MRKMKTDRTTKLLIVILCLFLISEFPQVSSNLAHAKMEIENCKIAFYMHFCFWWLSIAKLSPSFSLGFAKMIIF